MFWTIFSLSYTRTCEGHSSSHGTCINPHTDIHLVTEQELFIEECELSDQLHLVSHSKETFIHFTVWNYICSFNNLMKMWEIVTNAPYKRKLLCWTVWKTLLWLTITTLFHCHPLLSSKLVYGAHHKATEKNPIAFLKALKTKEDNLVCFLNSGSPDRRLLRGNYCCFVFKTLYLQESSFSVLH